MPHKRAKHHTPQTFRVAAPAVRKDVALVLGDETTWHTSIGAARSYAFAASNRDERSAESTLTYSRDASGFYGQKPTRSSLRPQTYEIHAEGQVIVENTRVASFARVTFSTPLSQSTAPGENSGLRIVRSGRQGGRKVIRAHSQAASEILLADGETVTVPYRHKAELGRVVDSRQELTVRAIHVALERRQAIEQQGFTSDSET